MRAKRNFRFLFNRNRVRMRQTTHSNAVKLPTFKEIAHISRFSPCNWHQRTIFHFRDDDTQSPFQNDEYYQEKSIAHKNISNITNERIEVESSFFVPFCFRLNTFFFCSALLKLYLVGNSFCRSPCAILQR